MSDGRHRGLTLQRLFVPCQDCQVLVSGCVTAEGNLVLNCVPDVKDYRSILARLLFVVDKIPKHERDRLRRDPLDDCHRHALAMVKLVETLEGPARVAP